MNATRKRSIPEDGISSVKFLQSRMGHRAALPFIASLTPRHFLSNHGRSRNSPFRNSCEFASRGKPKETQPPHAYIIGISPFLDKSVKDDVYRGVIRLVVEELPLNSTLSIYDAFELKTITRISLPDAHVFKSSKTRANQFAPAIRDLKQFLAQEHSKPTNLAPQFPGGIALAPVFRFSGRNPASGQLSKPALRSPHWQSLI